MSPAPSDLVTHAARALAAHRLRATLSSIGIVVGVATVMAALAIGEGARREAVDQVSSLGIDNILVRSTDPSSPAMSAADLAALQTVPGVADVAASRSIRTVVAADAARRDVMLVGATGSWARVFGTAIGEGHWLTSLDERDRHRVAVLGDRLARALFGSRSPIGERLLAGRDWFEVVGVLAAPLSAPKTRGAIQRVDPADSVIVPFMAMDMKIGAGDAPGLAAEIAVRTAGADRVEPAAAAIRRAMDRLHPRETGYEIVVPRELLRARLRALRAFNIVLLAIGGLALLISGVGIMNIMLASVSERTAEIGVRRAFGATRRAVIAQFAVEAALLCAVGGIAGVVVGALLSGVIALAAGWPVSISIAAVLIALLSSMVVGLTFGIYPARLAAELDPAEALRAP